ncbi:MAG: ABC transporter permease, partial [Segatella copri]
MNLVWKLLRQHISIPQFAGFAFANLFGMLIVLFGFQFYKDVLPVFTQEDSFMKADYLIMSKKIGMGNTISGRSNTFTGAEIDDVRDQKFVKKVGKFTSTEYKVDAQMGVNGVNVLNSELFFESVPDGFVDVPLKDWKYTPGAKEVPIILPRTYINMYNFGFAQSHSLPKISDGLMGMIDFNIQIQAAGKKEQFKGKVIGFSSRLNTILVPQAFMDWSNQEFAPNQKSDPNRLIVEVGNPGDENITK